MEAEVEERAIPQGGPGGRHVKKRALKNKGLTVGFNEKDLRDYVTGFHKRKKRRRKEAQRKQEEALRRKCIEERKKRKLEKELSLYGGVVPTNDSEPGDKDENQDDMDQEEDKDQAEPVAGMQTYENEDLKVTVITSEISREEESYPLERKEAAAAQSVGADRRYNISVKKKPFKKSAKHRSHPKPRSKRDYRKNKKGGGGGETKQEVALASCLFV